MSGLHCTAGSRAVLGDPSPWLLVAPRHCWDLTACATSVNTHSSVLTQSSHGTSGEPLLPVKYEGAGTHLTQSVSLVIPDLDDKFCMRDFCLAYTPTIFLVNRLDGLYIIQDCVGKQFFKPKITMKTNVGSLKYSDLYWRWMQLRKVQLSCLRLFYILFSSSNLYF